MFKAPSTPIELIIVESTAQAIQFDLDITIHWLLEGEARETSTQRVLFREQVFPVCHARLLPSAPLDDPTWIAALPLIHKGAGAEANAGTEWSWSTWFARLGLHAPPPVGLR